VDVEDQDQVPAQSAVVQNGRNLIAEIERRICGKAVTSRPARAVGLAELDIPSACLLFEQPEVDSLPEESPAGLVVYLSPTEGINRFLQDKTVLICRSHQEIVDHSPIAHRLSRQSGRPVFSIVPAWVLDSLGWVELPGREARIAAAESRDESPLPALTGRDFLAELRALEEEPPVRTVPDHPGIRVRLAPGASLEKILCLDALAVIGTVLAGEEMRIVRCSDGLVVDWGRNPNAEVALVGETSLYIDSRGFVPDELPVFLVYLNSGPDPLSTWQSLKRRLGGGLLPEGCSLWSSSTDGRARGEVPDPHWYWVGGILGALFRAAGLETPSGDELTGRLRLHFTSDQIMAITQGISKLEELDAVTLDSTAPTDPFSTWMEREAPLLPESAAGNTGESQSECRRFHLTGVRPDADSEASLPLTPAVTAELEESSPASRYPYFLPDSETDESPPRTVVELLRETITEAEKEGESFPVLKTQLETLALWSGQAQEGLREAQDLQPVWRSMLERVRSDFDVSVHGKASLEKEIAQLEQRLPKSGRIVNFGSETALEFFSWASYRDRLPLRARFFEKCKDLRIRLEEILRADARHDPASRTPEALSKALGEWGGGWIDPGTLSQVLPETTGSQGLSAERKKRIESLNRDLVRFLDLIRETPALYLVSAEEDLSAPGGTALVHSDPFECAAGVVDGILMNVVEGVRALRVAELELAGGASNEAMDIFLAHFDWQSLTSQELLLVPPVLVVESSDRLTETTMSSLNRLLRTGYPVDIMITVEDSFAPAGPDDSRLTGLLPDFGYLGMAHREVFVLQSCPAEPEHLLKGLRKLVGNLGPGVAVVVSPAPGSSGEISWIVQKLAHRSRTFPCFMYDPALGDTWADRFSLEGNERPEERILKVEIKAETGGHSMTAIEEGLTFAHTAALKPEFSGHFYVIGPDAWDEDQVHLSEYLQEYKTQPPEGVPYIWMVSPERELCRAVVTREMVSACRDRMHSWGILQELGGLNNEYVRRAVAEVRAEMEESFAARTQEIEERARTQGATEAVDRLVALFSDPSSQPLPTGSPPPPMPAGSSAPEAPVLGEKPPVGSAAEAGPAAVAEPEVEEAEEELTEEPYIDSFLCTSCNDCINLNPLMFQYNADNQAYIADPTAGTFLQLVKAAEACPAKCIHPGSPRPGDETATPEVLERARALE